MKYIKFGFIPLVLVGLVILYIATKEGISNTSSAAPGATLHAKVNATPSVLLVQRIGIDLSERKNEDVSSELNEKIKALRPSYLRTTLHPPYTPNEPPAVLALSREIQANPWLVVPANTDNDDLSTLGSTLAQDANEMFFSNVIVEFEEADGEEINKNFYLISLTAGAEVPLVKTLNGHLSIDDPRLLIPSLFKTPASRCIFCSAQESLGSSENSTIPPLGLAVQMLNEVLAGSLHTLQFEKAENSLSQASFRTGETWSAAFVSTNSAPLEVALEFPEDARALPTYAKSLGKDRSIHPLETRTIGRTVSVVIPANSFVILGQNLDSLGE